MDASWKFVRYQKIAPRKPGGHGAVFTATHVFLNRQVAIKEIHASPEVADAYFEEAKFSANLIHPNITTVYDADYSQPYLIIVTELMDSDLADFLKNGRRCSPLQSISIIRQILSGLEYAHSKSIIHRDIKPTNILINTDLTVKICDFGEATSLKPNYYAKGRAINSYMPPESFDTTPKYDARSDLWSVGVIFFEILTGTLPFRISQATPHSEIKQALEQSQVPAISQFIRDIPDRFQQIF